MIIEQYGKVCMMGLKQSLFHVKKYNYAKILYGWMFLFADKE